MTKTNTTTRKWSSYQGHSDQVSHLQHNGIHVAAWDWDEVPALDVSTHRPVDIKVATFLDGTGVQISVWTEGGTMATFALFGTTLAELRRAVNAPVH